MRGVVWDLAIKEWVNFLRKELTLRQTDHHTPGRSQETAANKWVAVIEP
jgi:hypothetical protein